MYFFNVHNGVMFVTMRLLFSTLGVRVCLILSGTCTIESDLTASDRVLARLARGFVVENWGPLGP